MRELEVVQQSQDTGRVQGVVVFAALVLLGRDKAEGERWLESRKKEGRGREKTGREEKTARLGCAGRQRTAMNLRLCDSVVACYLASLRPWFYFHCCKQTNWKPVLGSPQPALGPLPLPSPPP